MGGQGRGDRGLIGPRHQAFVSQTPPRELRTRVGFALRRDVAVPEDAMRRDLVARRDIADQRDDGVDLRRRVIDEVEAWGGVIPKIDDLDADRACVELGVAAPKTLAGMPSAPVFIDQTIDRGRSSPTR